MRGLDGPSRSATRRELETAFNHCRALATDLAVAADSAPQHVAKAGLQNTGSVKVFAMGNWVGTPTVPSEKLTVTTSQATLTNPANCPNATYYVLEGASNVSRAMLLAAYGMKSNVQLWLYGDSCVDGAPVIVHVAIVQ